MFDVTETSYDNFMGRYSFRLAPAFATFAGVEAGARVVDVGAGTGALTRELQRRGAVVAAAEPSEPFVRALRERLSGVDVQAAPAEALPWPDDAFDSALAQLVVAFMRDPAAGIAEMRRVVRPGGIVAVTMWDREGMEMLAAVQRTQQAFGATGETTEARMRFRSFEELEQLFAGGGFSDVRTELLEVESEYTGFDELWSALVHGAGPAGAWTKQLDEPTRARAQAELHRQLGSPAGPFTLRARAWATRGRRS